MNEATKQRLIAYITEHANEEELLELCEQIQDRMRQEARNRERLDSFLKTAIGKAATARVSHPPKPVVETTVSETTNGPSKESGSSKVAVKRISKAVFERLRKHLSTGPDTLSNISVVLDMSTGKASATLHVLAERGFVKTDGKTWSLI